MTVDRKEGVEASEVSLPKFVRFKSTGKVYKVDEETSEGVLMTQIHPDTYEPISNEQILSTRATICESAKPYPFADTEFFANLRASKRVRETATEKTYKIIKFNFDIGFVELENENGRRFPISLEGLYNSFVAVKEREDTCSVCKEIKSSTDKILS